MFFKNAFLKTFKTIFQETIIFSKGDFNTRKPEFRVLLPEPTGSLTQIKTEDTPTSCLYYSASFKTQKHLTMIWHDEIT